MLKIPDNSRYKKENPLRYQANRLIDVAQERPEVARVINERLGFDVKEYKIN